MSQTELRLPEQLGGPWEHVVVLSYGLDLPFFERALARQLPATCRNRILLGDERTHLASCDAYARANLVHSAGRAYVAEPILRRSPSHAKVILLTSPHAGRLLVGSGNISLQGFGSGGELFTSYSFSQEDDADLAEFVAIREFLERLRDEDILTSVAAWHLDRVLDETGWLYRQPADPASRVRHNLDRSFTAQLEDAIAGEPVDELHVLAPFFDEKLAALRDLIKRLDPGHTRVLLQPGRAPIDPDELDRLRREAEGALSVYAIERRPAMPWLHAKLILAKTPSRSVCLQGSANLSAAALVRTGSESNLEVVNLLRGERDTFDAVIGVLTLGEEVGDLAPLQLVYKKPTDEDHLTVHGWQLTAAEWSGGTLNIRYRGEPPELEGAAVLADGQRLTTEIVERQSGLLQLRISDADGRELEGLSPIALAFADGMISNAIFPADRAALQGVLESGSESGDKLQRLGDLDLEDEELAELLQELEAALVVDLPSLWQLAGLPDAGDSDDDSDEARIAYKDVDYDALRSHPKLQQYFRGAGPGAPRSALQILLNAITAAFGDLVAPPPSGVADPFVITDPPPDGGEDGDDDRPRKHWTAQARLSVLVRNFVRRLLRGFQSPKLHDAVGPVVVAHNYVVFLHLLSRLLDREWIDYGFVADAIAQTLTLIWGDEDSAGYVAGLEENELAALLELVRTMHSDAQLLATIYRIARETRSAELHPQRVGIRNAWRGMLLNGRPPYGSVVLSEARLMLVGSAPPDGPTPAVIVDELCDLAWFATRGELIADLAARIEVPETACVFVYESVNVPGLGAQNVRTLRIEHDTAKLGLDDARWGLRAWMLVDQLPRYRLVVSTRDGRHTRYVAIYEPGAKRGRYAAPAEHLPHTPLLALHAPPAPWDDSLVALMETAAAASVIASDAAAV